MTTHFADRLTEAIRQRGTPACVGFDPVFERLPAELRGDPASAASAFVSFGRQVFERVAPLVGVVKINIAFFEPYRGPGVDAYFELVRIARQLGLMVIGDVKRGDIGHSSAAYAAAHLDGDAADAVTVHSYLGRDGVLPFIESAGAAGKGVFVLVHTSNASAGEVQHVRLAEGELLASRMARLVDEWGRAPELIGKCGYGCVGAVVAPDDVSLARKLRSDMPRSIFLVPGFGAQGREVEQVAACFKPDGSGAIVNASRSVIYAFDPAGRGGVWAGEIEAACRKFVNDLKAING